MYSDVLVEEAKGLEEERRAKEARRARRAAEAFSAMLRHHKGITADTTWEEAQGVLSGEPEWAEVADSERKALFEEAMVRLQARNKDKERSKRKVCSGIQDVAVHGARQKDESEGESGDSGRRKSQKKKKHKKESKKKHKRCVVRVWWLATSAVYRRRSGSPGSSERGTSPEEEGMIGS